MGSAIVAKVQENSTPIVVLQQYEFGDGAGVLSVRIKNDKKGPQTGDVVLDLDDATISLLNYDKNYEYKTNNVCIYDGMLYRAKVVPTFGQFKAEEWEELDKVDILAEDYRPNFAYEKNQICIINHMFYRAKKDFVSPNVFNISDWEEIGGATIDDYQLNVLVNRWQPIIYNNAIYRAKDDFTTSNAGNIVEGWKLDKDKFEEIKSGDSIFLLKESILDYDLATKTFSITKTKYQLNSSKKETFIDLIQHDETINIIKTNAASGIKLNISIPIAKYDKLGLIKSAKEMNNPHYRGQAASQGTMDSFTNPKYRDFCDRLDTNSEWFFDGALWVNTNKPFNSTNHQEILENYVQVDDEGFGFVRLTSDSTLRIANNSEAERRIDTNFAVNPAQLALYGGNLRIIDTFSSLPGIGKEYDLYWLEDERRFYIYKDNNYSPINVEIKNFENNYNYPKNSIIIKDKNFYRSKNNFVSNNWNLNDWEKIGLGIETYKNNTSYLKDTFVYYNGSIYYAKNDIPASSSFNESLWEKLTNSNTDTLTSNNLDFYVDEVNGNNNNSGLLNFPFKTLNYAISKVKDKISTKNNLITIHILSNIDNAIDLENLKNIKFIFTNTNNKFLKLKTKSE